MHALFRHYFSDIFIVNAVPFQQQIVEAEFHKHVANTYRIRPNNRTYSYKRTVKQFPRL